MENYIGTTPKTRLIKTLSKEKYENLSPYLSCQHVDLTYELKGIGADGQIQTDDCFTHTKVMNDLYNWNLYYDTNVLLKETTTITPFDTNFISYNQYHYYSHLDQDLENEIQPFRFTVGSYDNEYLDESLRLNLNTIKGVECEILTGLNFWGSHNYNCNFSRGKFTGIFKIHTWYNIGIDYTNYASLLSNIPDCFSTYFSDVWDDQNGFDQSNMTFGRLRYSFIHRKNGSEPDTASGMYMTIMIKPLRFIRETGEEGEVSQMNDLMDKFIFQPLQIKYPWSSS